MVTARGCAAGITESTTPTVSQPKPEKKKEKRKTTSSSTINSPVVTECENAAVVASGEKRVKRSREEENEEGGIAKKKAAKKEEDGLTRIREKNAPTASSELSTPVVDNATSRNARTKKKKEKANAAAEEDPTHPAWIAAQSVQQRGCIVTNVTNSKITFDDSDED